MSHFSSILLQVLELGLILATIAAAILIQPFAGESRGERHPGPSGGTPSIPHSFLLPFAFANSWNPMTLRGFSGVSSRLLFLES